MNEISEDSISEATVVNFGHVPVDSVVEKKISVENNADKPLTYRVAHMHYLNIIDNVFKMSITSTPVNPNERAEVKIQFKPRVPGQSYTEHYIVDDTGGNLYKLIVTGKSIGPKVCLGKKKVMFRICKNSNEQRKEVIDIVNKSGVDTTYQWLLPISGQGNFQITTGNCGLIRALETISTTILFTGTALGIYIAEFVCLVLDQAPLFLNVVASVVLPGNPMFNVHDHMFGKHWVQKCYFTHLMENSLNSLSYIPSASVFDRHLDFGTGCIQDVTKNISQTLSVTNHEQDEGYIQWMQDPENIFLIDPIASVIPSNESKLFTVRFRPKLEEEAYSYLMCGDFQHKIFEDSNNSDAKLKHTWFRIPCIGNTWSQCTEWITQWDCPAEVVLPPTVPGRKTFTNFMLSNKLETPMCFKFQTPENTNFVVMPLCGIVPSRGWQIISVALEAKSIGEYYENWDISINKSQTARICLCGNAETSQVKATAQGYHPDTHAMCEFPPTITGCTNYCTAYLQNLTRMAIHIRVLNSVPWLGADNCGTIVLPAKEIISYHWWFFPTEPNKVYTTTVTCTCVCLIDDRPVGEPTELFIHISGFSEFPDLRVLPKTCNLHDILVKDSASCLVTLYNYSSCYFTSKLYHEIDGMGDDYSDDQCEIDSTVNSLKPSTHCDVRINATPSGAGARQISIKYTVLFRDEYGEIREIQPVTKTICIVWYDGIYPTIKVKRTISVKSPVILSNHCIWNIMNIEELNKALVECRPNKPLDVNLYAPDLCVGTGAVEFILVMGSVYRVNTAWTLRREKICDCEMIEVPVGLSFFTMKHTCEHRLLIEFSPLSGQVIPYNAELLYLKLNYIFEGPNTLCYILDLPNERTINIYVHMMAYINSKGMLTALRRPVYTPEYLAVLDCGKVPINNLHPVMRIVWLYNPTNVFTTWRLLRGTTMSPDSVIRCLLYFAEVPPLGRLGIPFSFLPTEMIDYEMTFSCSFGYDTMKILVKGQGGLPNCVETRLDIPYYVDKAIRSAYREDVVYLTLEHITIPIMPTHSLSRDIIAICNDTDHTMRFIWLPERIPNIVNVVMTPCWGVLQPKSTEWITMTVYTLQAPATFTTTVACEILDLSERRRYQRNEMLRRSKTEKCNQEFIITEEGLTHPDINDSPPYVLLDLEKPEPFYLALTVAICSKGQLDGYPRMVLKQMWEQTPPYDMLSTDVADSTSSQKGSNNNMTIADIIRIIDGILWDALHSKMFKHQIKFYSKEEIPTYSQLVKSLESNIKPRLSRRVTSGICDAIVNKAVFHVYGLNPKHEVSILEAE